MTLLCKLQIKRKVLTVLVQEFYGGKKDLSKYKTDIESFICALMPGSSSLQIQTTAGTYIHLLKSLMNNLDFYMTLTKLINFLVCFQVAFCI